MFTNRGVLFAVALLAAGGFLLSPPPASTGPDAGSATAVPTADAVKADFKVKLERDGKMSITEVVTVPDGRGVTQVAPLRIPGGDAVDRVFSVSGTSVEGNGRIEVGADRFTVHLGGGSSTVKYVVDGVVANLGDHQEVRWRLAGGWDADLKPVSASVITPASPRGISCLSGAIGSTSNCTDAQVFEAQVLRIKQDSLHAGERIDLTVDLDPGTVPANAKVDRTGGLARAFELTPATGTGLAGLTLLLLGGLWLLWRVRGRDARVLAADIGPVHVLVQDEAGRVAFASPDGVLPGQLGTVLDEHVDVVDVSATVVDLAVRNYLWIEELAGEVPDWRIFRRNPVDASLTAYERVLYRVLLPDGVDHVLLSELGGIDLTPVRDAMYADVVRRDWFTRRPDTERGRWWWVGLGLAGVGIALTAVLAVTVGYALLGLAVVIAGGALVVAARWMPARTKRGSALLGQVRGLHEYLYGATPEHIPDDDREMVFSRSLPYAVVLGAGQRWLDTFGGTGSEADGDAGPYWYAGPQRTTGPTRFTSAFPVFLNALEGVLARAGQLRSQGA